MNVIPKSDERGAALIIALLVMLVLIVVSAGLVTTSVVNTKISGVDERRSKALDMAEAGISEAISWAFAVSVFGAAELGAPVAGQTLSTVLKYPEDEDTVRQAGLAAVVGRMD